MKLPTVFSRVKGFCVMYTIQTSLVVLLYIVVIRARTSVQSQRGSDGFGVAITNEFVDLTQNSIHSERHV